MATIRAKSNNSTTGCLLPVLVAALAGFLVWRGAR